jgi:hypothetical protein
MGLKTNVPPNSPTLLKPMGEGVALSYCVDCNNVEFSNERMEVVKGPGRTEWSNSAAPTTQTCLGMFELDVGGTRTHWVAMGDNSGNGRIFKYDGSRDPQEVNDGVGGGTEYADDPLSKYCFLQFGGYMIFCDNGEHTPYCVDSDDANLSKLVDQDTEYKPKYIEQFQRRILAANIDTAQITNGDISVIWATADGGGIPAPSTNCTFGTGNPPTNHLFRPVDDPITGLRAVGRNACFVWGAESIDSLDYFANYTTPFGMRNLSPNQGFVNNAGVVSTGSALHGFNENYGFCEFRGGEFPHGGKPTSDDIEDTAASIARTYYNHIVGKFIPHKQSIYWAVPLNGSTTPNAVLKYHLVDRTWSKSDIVTYWIDNWVTDTDVSWNDLLAQGFTTSDDIASYTWTDFVSENPGIMFSSTDGKTYLHAGTSNAGSNYDGRREEPILDFGRPNDKDLLLEIWFDFTNQGSFNLYVEYRGGNTPAEVEAASWDSLPEVSCNTPANAVCYLSKVNRFHQIRYGTDASAEGFGINAIEFKYQPQGRY